MRKQTFILSLTLVAFWFGVNTISNAQSHKSKASSKSDVSIAQSVSSACYTADGKPMVIVTVTIKKNAYKGGVGRIEETFPGNMQAMLISSGMASFQGGNGKAVFMWNSVPEDRQITVSYAIVANATSSDNETVAGQFYYQNQPFKIDPASFTLTVNGSQVYQPTVPTNTSTLDDLYYSVTGSYPKSAYSNSPVVVASAPAPSNSNVTPSNITASASKPSPAAQQQMGATTSAQPHVAVPAPAQQMAASPNIAVGQQQTSVANPTAGNAQQNTEMASSNTPATQQQQSSATENTTTKTEPLVSSSRGNHSKAPAIDPVDSSNAKTSGHATAANGDLVYRVQVIVVGSKLRLHRFFRKHGISDEAIFDPADDLPVRVMVGSYPDYKSAKIRCTDLISKGVIGAFVVSYYKGKRIPVAQAITMAK